MLQEQNLILLLAAGLLCVQWSSLLCVAEPSGTKCPPVKGRESETCVCQTRDGFMIDMSSLGNTDGTPRYAMIGMHTA